jgi:hypothetical protein
VKGALQSLRRSRRPGDGDGDTGDKEDGDGSGSDEENDDDRGGGGGDSDSDGGGGGGSDLMERGAAVKRKPGTKSTKPTGVSEEDVPALASPSSLKQKPAPTISEKKRPKSATVGVADDAHDAAPHQQQQLQQQVSTKKSANQSTKNNNNNNNTSNNMVREFGKDVSKEEKKDNSGEQSLEDIPIGTIKTLMLVPKRDPKAIVEYDDDGNEIPLPPIAYSAWTCLVCKRKNCKPAKAPVESDVYFGEAGVYYKRTYAMIKARRDVATCDRCYTYCDYTPPLGSAHIFPYNPDPFVAFDQYPKPSTVQAGLKPDIKSRYYYSMKGFFLGIKDNINSAPLKNDWRLRKFVNNRFPVLPRYKLKPGEFFQLGEIVECKQQKFAWARARIMKVNTNHTYDIRYDPGDEIRFVEESGIRTIPEKRAYAFRVEMGVVLIAVLTPLGMALGIMSGNPGLSMIGLLVVSAGLLCVRVVVFVQYFYNYYHAGMLAILGLTSLYTLPLLFLVIASAIGLSAGADPSAWLGVTILLILTKAFALPVMYIYRPPYLVIAAAIFSQTSLGLILVSSNLLPYLAISLAPFITTAICLKILRKFLFNVWDVCLIMRPARDTEFENPSIVGRVKDELLSAMGLD